MTVLCIKFYWVFYFLLQLQYRLVRRRELSMPTSAKLWRHHELMTRHCKSECFKVNCTSYNCVLVFFSLSGEFPDCSLQLIDATEIEKLDWKWSHGIETMVYFGSGFCSGLEWKNSFSKKYVSHFLCNEREEFLKRWVSDSEQRNKAENVGLGFCLKCIQNSCRVMWWSAVYCIHLWSPVLAIACIYNL